MGGFGSISHWIIVLIIIVLLFGSKKIPELAQGIGKGIKSFKKEMDDEPEKIGKKDEEISKTTNDTTKQA